ncbi:Superkiller protein 3 [Tulasnella sp. 418]|nr:Superkiller protein 3 [Tulasnella sp. 418]
MKQILNILEHAIGISPDVPEADLEYATRTFARFTKIQGRQSFVSPEEFFTPFSVLNLYVQQRPLDATALHLFALICERLG